MQLQSVEIGACVAAVESHFHRIAAELETWRSRLVMLFEAGPVDSAAVAAEIEPRVRRFLGAAPLVGGGYVAAPGALVDHRLYLAWWQGDAQQLLAQSSAPDSGDPLDYTRHPWFRTPERTGLPHVTGPYVDFVCSDEYVMTFTAPVTVGGQMVGVVGADTLVETLESIMLPSLRAAGATLVNDQGRTVVSSDPHRATGTRLDTATAREVASCAGLPLAVVTT
jgi:hypothetical protein